MLSTVHFESGLPWFVRSAISILLTMFDGGHVVVVCSCLVGQSGVFQWRGALINGTQIDTFGLIAASLSMVEAVSCTAVNLQVDKVVEF